MDDHADTAGRPRKRSMTIAGHRTSISLEEPFWQALQEMARAEGLSPTEFVTRIDAERGRISLSSAIRLHLFAASRANIDR